MTPERLRELKFQVRRHMNGEVAGIMKDLDNSYVANYGMSLQHARDVAASENLSAQDCVDLWETGWRDLMLIAAAGIKRHDPEVCVIATWAATVKTLELADALPFLLAGGMSGVCALVGTLLSRDEGFDFAMAANFIGREIVARQMPEFYDAAWRENESSDFADWKKGMEPVAALAACVLLLAEKRNEWTFAEGKSISFLARQCVRLRRYGDCFSFCSENAVRKIKESARGRNNGVADDIEAEEELFG